MSQLRLELIRDLQERLRALERSCRPVRPERCSTGLAGLDQLLPSGGLEGGTLLEWLGDGEGAGSATLALMVAAHAWQGNGAVVVLDGKREFYPPAAARLGVPLEYTVIVRPDHAADALWALEQALRCRAVAVVVAGVGELSDRSFRRLQLAAEAGGTLGFLLRPAACRATPSWAEARLLVQAVPSSRPTLGRRLRVEVLHCRGGAAGQAVELELSDETDPMRVVAPVADPAFSARVSGA